MKVFMLMLVLMASLAGASCVVPEDDIKINASVLLCSGEYAVNRIGLFGSNIEFACNNTILRGDSQGYALGITNGKNITIKGCHIRSYEVAIVVQDTRNARIEGNFFADNKIGIAHGTSEIVEQDNQFTGSLRQDIMEMDGKFDSEARLDIILMGKAKLPAPSQILTAHVEVLKPDASIEDKESEIESFLKKFESSQQYLKINRTFRRNPNNSTTITLTILPLVALENVSIYESVPKCVAQYVHQMVIRDSGYEVIERDPLLLWTFSSLSAPKSLSYDVFRPVDEECSKLLLAIGIASPAMRIGEEAVQKSPKRMAFYGLIAGIVLLSLLYVALRSQKK